jgi:hypothetical protein
MMDILESERASTDVNVTARLAFYAMDYLPWEVVWQPIERMVNGENYRALAALMAEHLKRPEASAEAYKSLCQKGTGLMAFAKDGLERIGATPKQITFPQ